MRAPACFIPTTALLCLTPASASEAEELKVLSAVGMRQVLVELAPTFERASGYKLAVTFDSGARIAKRIAEGEAADVVIVPHEGAKQLVAVGGTLPGLVTELASSRVGVAVRARDACALRKSLGAQCRRSAEFLRRLR